MPSRSPRSSRAMAGRDFELKDEDGTAGWKHVSQIRDYRDDFCYEEDDHGA